jgi:hypothetical protein
MESDSCVSVSNPHGYQRRPGKQTENVFDTESARRFFENVSNRRSTQRALRRKEYQERVFRYIGVADFDM